MTSNVYRYARLEHRKFKAWRHLCANWRKVSMEAEETIRRLRRDLEDAQALSRTYYFALARRRTA